MIEVCCSSSDGVESTRGDRRSLKSHFNLKATHKVYLQRMPPRPKQKSLHRYQSPSSKGINKRGGRVTTKAKVQPDWNRKTQSVLSHHYTNNKKAIHPLQNGRIHR